MTDDVYKRSYRPILLSRADVLTEGTAKQIENDNDVFWCAYPSERPKGFDTKICDPKKGN